MKINFLKMPFVTICLVLFVCSVLSSFISCSSAYRQTQESFIVTRSFETGDQAAGYVQGALKGALDALKERSVEAQEYPSPFVFGDEQKLYKCSYEGGDKFLFVARKGNKTFLCTAAPSIKSLKKALKKYEE